MNAESLSGNQFLNNYILKRVMLVNKAKNFFFNELERSGNAQYRGMFEKHLSLLDKWADKLIDLYPGADKEIIKLSVWLHDVGYFKCEDFDREDHALYSEEKTRQFLKQNNYPSEKIEKVAHCVRAHRCNDVQPKSLEAKIVAVADSASHFTDAAYLSLIQRGKKQYAIDKLERDFRDVSILPEIKKELEPLHVAWKNLLEVFPDWKIKDLK